MIISHKHKYIFIKTQKTAGTSVEIALSKYCGQGDVITPISPRDEKTRQELGFPGPQNFKLPISKYSARDWMKRLIRPLGKPGFFNHISAGKIKQRLPADIWQTYFKFCFERNPWDKAISWYYWLHRTEPRPSLSDFIQSGQAKSVQGLELYSIDGKLVVDKVYRFEEIDSAMEDIARRLNLPEVPLLPKAKSGIRKDARHYAALLSDGDRDRIARDFAKEIEYFGYQW